MNQRDYDLIVRAAFGESERGEEAFVEEMLRRDPEAKALFEEFSSLQGGLHDLDDVPACQLSTERLRQAILDQGVKPLRRAPFRAFWGVGVAAAACLALTFVVFRQQTESKAELDAYKISAGKTLSEPLPSTQGTPTTPAPVDEAVPPGEYVADSSELSLPDMGTVMESGAKSAVKQTRKAHRRESVSMMTSGAGSSKDKVPAARDMTLADTARSKASEYPSNQVPMADAAKFDAAVPEGPVVFVQPQTDPQTGASLAVETNHASDFVFGG